MIQLRELYAVLILAWHKDTAFGDRWVEVVPDLGQCAVTALVVQDYFGGDLLRCPFPPDGSHYWNRLLSGEEVDLTRGQCEYLGIMPLRHEATVRARDYVLSNSDTQARYRLLAQRVKVILARVDG